MASKKVLTDLVIGDLSTGKLGVGVTPTYKFHTAETITAADGPEVLAMFDYNVNGSTVMTADRTKTAVRIDLDDTTTGGDASDEVRLYGINLTVDSTGSADDVVGIGGLTQKAGTSDLAIVRGIESTSVSNQTGGSIATLQGAYIAAISKGNSGSATIANQTGVSILSQTQTNTDKVVNNLYGLNVKTEAATSSNGGGANTSMIGINSELEKDSNTLNTGNGYVYKGTLDGNGGSFTNTYLLKLEFSLSGTTISGHQHGIHVSGEVKNYFSGDVGVGASNPDEKLHINGNVKADSYIKDGGTSSQFLKADGSVDSSTYLTSASIGGFIDGSGSAGTILKFTDSDTVEDSIITEDSSKIGIDIASPKAALHVNGAVIVGNDTTAASADLAGALRYWDEQSGGTITSYVDMCMKWACGYQWVNILTNRTACE